MSFLTAHSQHIPSKMLQLAPTPDDFKGLED